MLRSLAAALVLVVALASPAAAVHTPPGRGPSVQAEMLSTIVYFQLEPVQVLNRSCADPQDIRRCRPIRPVEQRAIEDAVATPIVWVPRKLPGHGEFWVLAPVVFGKDTATSEFAWWQAGKYGCYGWTRYRWARDGAGWSDVGGVGIGTCPARPV